MSYTCYLHGVVMPTPAKLTVKMTNQNKTLTLLNEGEVNFLRRPGLKELTVPFVFSMLEGSHTPVDYLDLLEALKENRKTTQFILARRSPDGRALFDTNLTVSVEDYEITEDAASGPDVSVEVNLKQWRDYQLKILDEDTLSVTQGRDDSTAPTAKTYTVRKGDSLWAIAAKYYGSGAQYAKIYSANTDQISNPNLIYPGQVLIIP